MPAPMGNRLAISHGLLPRHLRGLSLQSQGLSLQFQAWSSSCHSGRSPSPGITASIPGALASVARRGLAISGGYRFSSRGEWRGRLLRARHLRGLPLQFQAIPTQVVCGASPSPRAIASLSTASPPKPPRGERNSSSIPSSLRESAHKGPGVLNHRANEPSMTICALLCPR